MTDLDAISPDDVANRPMVYKDSQGTFYRASSLLSCPRAFIFSRLGYPTKVPPNLQQAFQYGTDNESRVIDILEARTKSSVVSKQNGIRWEIRRGIFITGHIDGFINGHVLEVKCLSHENTEKFRDDWEANFPYYAWQISVYMHSFKVPALFAILDKSTDEVHEIEVHTPPISESLITAQILALESQYKIYQDSDHLPDCKTITFCPYYHLHKDYADEPETPFLDPQTSGLVVAYKTITDKIKALEETQKRLRTQLDARLEGVVSGRTKDFLVNQSTFSSSRLRTDAVRKKIRELKLEDELIETTTSTRLTIKPVDDGGDA